MATASSAGGGAAFSNGSVGTRGMSAGDWIRLQRLKGARGYATLTQGPPVLNVTTSPYSTSGSNTTTLQNAGNGITATGSTVTVPTTGVTLATIGSLTTASLQIQNTTNTITSSSGNTSTSAYYTNALSSSTPTTTTYSSTLSFVYNVSGSTNVASLIVGLGGTTSTQDTYVTINTNTSKITAYTIGGTTTSGQSISLTPGTTQITFTITSKTSGASIGITAGTLNVSGTTAQTVFYPTIQLASNQLGTTTTTTLTSFTYSQTTATTGTTTTTATASYTQYAVNSDIVTTPAIQQPYGPALLLKPVVGTSRIRRGASSWTDYIASQRADYVTTGLSSNNGVVIPAVTTTINNLYNQTAGSDASSRFANKAALPNANQFNRLKILS